MPKQPASTGTPPAKTPAPATAVPDIEKAMHEIEEMQKTLKAQKEEQEKREKELDAREASMPKKNPNEQALVAAAHQTKAMKMREFLHSQPKVTIMIPLDPGENPNTTVPVTLNGYRYTIKKNVYVEVPKQVAEVIMNSLKQTTAAGQTFLMNGDRPAKGGISVEEALA